MSTPPIELPLTHSPAPAPSAQERQRLVTRARTLSLLTIGWMSIETVVALLAAVIAGSVALLGFGLDSLIELLSAGTILWLYTRGRHDTLGAERRAQQAVAACFVALALYLTIDATQVLARNARPSTSWPGVLIAIGAIVLMPLLARAKRRVAIELDSAATAGDSAQSRLCAVSAGAVLISLLGNQQLGWWWLDPITGLAIAALAAHEAHHAWSGKICADCAPVPISTAAHAPHRHDDCC